MAVVERDYPNVYKRFTALGPLMEQGRQRRQGIAWNTQDEVEQLGRAQRRGGDRGGRDQGMAKIETDIDACEVVLQLAPETNGHVAGEGLGGAVQATGREHATWRCTARTRRSATATSRRSQRKIISSPTWSGIGEREGLYNAGYPTSTS